MHSPFMFPYFYQSPLNIYIWHYTLQLFNFFSQRPNCSNHVKLPQSEEVLAPDLRTLDVSVSLGIIAIQFPSQCARTYPDSCISLAFVNQQLFLLSNPFWEVTTYSWEGSKNIRTATGSWNFPLLNSEWRVWKEILPLLGMGLNTVFLRCAL